MNSDQFLYWVSGYISGMRHDENVKQFADVLYDVMKEIQYEGSNFNYSNYISPFCRL